MGDTSVTIVRGSSGDGVNLAYNAAGEHVLAIYASDGRTEDYTYTREKWKGARIISQSPVPFYGLLGR